VPEFIATCNVSPTIKGELRSAIAGNLVDRMIGGVPYSIACRPENHHMKS
jgi:hypothetical protein